MKNIDSVHWKHLQQFAVVICLMNHTPDIEVYVRAYTYTHTQSVCVSMTIVTRLMYLIKDLIKIIINYTLANVDAIRMCQ